MTLVLQRGPLDCGVACVAMLAGVSYETAAAAVGPIGRDGTRCSQLRRALDRLGVRTAARRVPLKYGHPIPDGVLLNLKILGSLRGHWLVHDAGGRILCPTDGETTVARVSRTFSDGTPFTWLSSYLPRLP